MDKNKASYFIKLSGYTIVFNFAARFLWDGIIRHHYTRTVAKLAKLDNANTMVNARNQMVISYRRYLSDTGRAFSYYKKPVLPTYQQLHQKYSNQQILQYGSHTNHATNTHAFYLCIISSLLIALVVARHKNWWLFYLITLVCSLILGTLIFYITLNMIWVVTSIILSILAMTALKTRRKYSQ